MYKCNVFRRSGGMEFIVTREIFHSVDFGDVWKFAGPCIWSET